MSNSIPAFLDRVTGGTAAAGSPGYAVAVVRGTEVLARECRGLAGPGAASPVTPQTLFGVASVGRQFACATALVLADAGTLALDDDVRRWIPELPVLDPSVRLRHLMAETSGIRDLESLLPLVGIGYADPMPHDRALDLILRQRGTCFPAGRQYLRSNSGLRLLAVAIERATGRSYADVLAEDVLRPVGAMSARMAGDGTAAPDGVAVPCTDDGGGPVAATGLWASYRAPQAAEGGMLASLDDLVAWARSFATEPLGKDLFARLEAPQRLDDGGWSPATLGLVRGEHRGHPTLSQTGICDGYASAFLRVPGRELTVVCLANHDGEPTPEAIVRGLADLVLGVPTAGGAPGPSVASSAGGAAPAAYLDREARLVMEWGGAPAGRQVTYFSWPMPLERRGDGRLHTTPQEVAISVGASDLAADAPTLEVSFGGRELVLDRARAPRPTEIPVHRLTGTYRGPDLPGVTWRVARHDDGLGVTTQMPDGSSTASDLSPLAPDVFAVGEIPAPEPGGHAARPVIVRFDAAGPGPAPGLWLSTILAQGIRLDRDAEPG